MNDIDTCAHKFCSCPAAGDGRYCSEYCEKAAEHDKPEIACNCDHQECE